MRRFVRWGALAAVVVAACSDPHAPPRVDRLDCNACHADRYDLATLHAERGYSRNCWECHGTAATTGWNDAVARHDRFRIDREPHAGFDCYECHRSKEDHTDVTCIDCHSHTEGRTNAFHVGFGGYSYTPRACFDCHGSGDRRGGD